MAMQQQYDDDQAGGLFINIVPELRRRIKKAATQSNLSEQEYVGRILEQAVPPDIHTVQQTTGKLNRDAVNKLLRYREEIRHAHPGVVFEDSAELIHQAREERTRELEQR